MTEIMELIREPPRERKPIEDWWFMKGMSVDTRQSHLLTFLKRKVWRKQGIRRTHLIWCRPEVRKDCSAVARCKWRRASFGNSVDFEWNLKSTLISMSSGMDEETWNWRTVHCIIYTIDLGYIDVYSICLEMRMDEWDTRYIFLTLSWASEGGGEQPTKSQSRIARVLLP
jgi:hypothetical protein